MSTKYIVEIDDSLDCKDSALALTVVQEFETFIRNRDFTSRLWRRELVSRFEGSGTIAENGWNPCFVPNSDENNKLAESVIKHRTVNLKISHGGDDEILFMGRVGEFTFNWLYLRKVDLDTGKPHLHFEKWI